PPALLRRRSGAACFPSTTLFRSDLLDRDDIEVWSPARQRLEIERVREQTRGRYTRKDLQVPEGPADKQACRSHKDQQKPCLQVLDRKSTRLNSSHVKSSYAVFCL